MELQQLLRDQGESMLQNAFQAMERSHLKSYEQEGMARAKQRLRDLYILTMRAVDDRKLGPIIAHAEAIAQERFAHGFDLWEVQTAFNVLEEAIWNRIIRELPPSSYAESLGLVSTVLGAGKDSLARAYVSLASKTKAPTLNLNSMFSGAAGA